MNKKKSFTLAETLITLTILGAIAVLVISNIINRISDRIAITQLKRAYALIDNAIQEMYVIEGLPDTWMQGYMPAQKTDVRFGKSLINHLPYEDYRDYGCCSHSNFFPKKYGHDLNSYYRKYKSLNGNITENIEGENGFPIILKNRMYISQIKANYYTYGKTLFYPDTKGIVTIRVDVNGIKGPNRYGYDVFFFTVDPEAGLNFKSTYDTAEKNNCNKNSNVSDANSGKSCAYWVLRHNNMAYKYRDVSNDW